ncbi:MAG: hypothetical protein IT557_11065 [Alphaproteobacteria bacterium]|nr:hypothetical protein [Alphaproteobacteria bacterium]
MFDVLDCKIRRMHAAFEALGTSDFSGVAPEIARTESYTAITLDFGKNADPTDLANAASLLIANIASLKDHLKVWCKKQGRPFNGDTLINTNRSVALIHDLWNVDKHAELTSRPRSGHVPKLRDIGQVARLSTGTSPDSGGFVTIDPRTGRLVTGSSGSGSATLTLVATIADESDNFLADFEATCSEAIVAWEKELRAAGVPLP